MKKKFILLIILAIIALTFIAIKVINIFVSLNKDLKELTPSTFVMTGEDSGIISPKYLPHVEVVEKHHSSKRNTVSQLLYDGQYQLLTYKIDLTREEVIDSLFYISEIDALQSNAENYTLIQNGYYLFKFKGGRPLPASKIYLTISGDSLNTIIKNDSVLNYRLLCDNLSIRYLPNAPVDLFVVGKSKGFGTIKIPMDILFLVRRNSLFLLIISPIDPKGKLPENLLYDIIMGN